ncbi:peptidoglycan-binding protein [Bosea sp. BK604]|uniref:peptidoglycan-binding protein n=1 Tax=Bosea sp. BK604 TaxID=2512180 RepID=UPI001052B4ED|nr:peptidoglycan-binding protein [Bosea sp. BK604]TCR70506.1 putative chitinase [Bosea sp. BK604]
MVAIVEKLGPKVLRALAPGGKLAIMEPVGRALPAVLAEFEINTPRRIEHFLPQAAHETDRFRTLEEYGGAAHFERYDGRADLGNIRPGDGALFHGRGVFQLTGRANYRQYGPMLGLDLERNPEIAADPVISLRIAGLYWRERKINQAADNDDIIGVTRLINGGKNGLADRRALLAIAKREVAALAAGDIANDNADNPVLRRGSDNDAVEILQARLRKFGLALTLDGDFGAATELAVRTFQQRAGLKDDGIVGPKTWAALYVAVAA